MSVSILVATPHAAFGELLRLSLEESGHYQVRLVLTAKEARASAARSVYPLAILDADLSDEPFIPLCYEMISKPARLMIVPPDNNANHPSLGGLIPHGYVYRPFYLPDLLEMVAKLTQPAQELPLPAVTALPGWASDPLAVKNLLEQELPGCDAISILIGMHEELLGSAGFLDDAPAHEMAKVLLRYWDPKEKTDLMRYVRLSSTRGDYLAYATSLVNDLVLMMIFEPTAQLSQVRPQTKQVAANMLSRAAEWQPAVQANSNGSASLAGSNNGHEDAVKIYDNSPLQPHAAPAGEPQFGQPASLDISDDDYDTHTVDISLLLGSIPSPDPIGAADKPAAAEPGMLMGWFPEPDEWKAAGDTETTEADPQAVETGPDERQQPPVTAEQEKGLTSLPALPIEADSQDQSQSPAITATPASLISQPITERDPSASEKAAERLLESAEESDLPTGPILRKPVEAGNANTVPAPFFMEPEPEVDPLSDTRPHVVNAITNMNQLEAASPALSLLNYTCVLLPRMPQHYLTGELADRLAQWVQHLCLAFGWRLEGISLRPEYLQWTVQVAPSVSPGNLVRIIRQRTSLHIFSTFEYIKQQNPSGDFWATGYLIVSGPQPPSAQLLREYIAQTRKRQGISKP